VVVTEAVVVGGMQKIKNKKYMVSFADGMELMLSSPEDSSTTCSSRVGF